jgi:hypothetical protein
MPENNNTVTSNDNVIVLPKAIAGLSKAERHAFGALYLMHYAGIRSAAEGETRGNIVKNVIAAETERTGTAPNATQERLIEELVDMVRADEGLAPDDTAKKNNHRTAIFVGAGIAVTAALAAGAYFVFGRGAVEAVATAAETTVETAAARR